jgi:hypothetical protein
VHARTRTMRGQSKNNKHANLGKKIILPYKPSFKNRASRASPRPEFP